jgi:hypothetical protein
LISSGNGGTNWFDRISNLIIIKQQQQEQHISGSIRERKHDIISIRYQTIGTCVCVCVCVCMCVRETDRSSKNVDFYGIFPEEKRRKCIRLNWEVLLLLLFNFWFGCLKCSKKRTKQKNWVEQMK